MAKASELKILSTEPSLSGVGGIIGIYSWDTGGGKRVFWCCVETVCAQKV